MTGPGAPRRQAAPRVPADLAADVLDRAVVGSLSEGRTFVHACVDSTIDECLALASAGAAEGTAVVADAQRRGRGQRGRRWLSPPSTSLSLSVLLRPPLPPADVATLTLLGGLSAVSALRGGQACDVFVKRPNDLVVQLAEGGWRKLGGVLVDTAIQGSSLRHAIVSLGLNVGIAPGDWPPVLRGRVTSLLELTGTASPRWTIVAAFLEQVTAWRGLLDELGPAAWAARLRQHHDRITVDLPGFELPTLPRTETEPDATSSGRSAVPS